MKKEFIILSVFAALAFSSCKRSYVCQCNLYNIENGKFIKLSTSEETLGKLGNQDAESASPACESKSFKDNDKFRETRCNLVRK